MVTRSGRHGEAGQYARRRARRKEGWVRTKEGWILSRDAGMPLTREVERFFWDLYGVARYCDRATTRRYFQGVIRSLPAIVRQRSLIPADVRMADHTCAFSPLRGGRIVVEGEYFSGAREIYCRRLYFSERGFDLGRDDVIVDLGANVGLFTTMAAIYGKRVVAVEAQSGFAPLIQSNLDRNQCRSKAEIEIALVGASSGLFSDEHARRQASHWQAPTGQMTFEELLDRHHLSEVDLLKIDIEGSEFDLILNTRADILKRCRRIVMEVHPEFGRPQELLARLDGMNFRTTVRDAEGRPLRSWDYVMARGGYVFAMRGDR